jgi:hypothetical protein
MEPVTGVEPAWSVLRGRRRSTPATPALERLRRLELRLCLLGREVGYPLPNSRALLRWLHLDTSHPSQLGDTFLMVALILEDPGDSIEEGIELVGDGLGAAVLSVLQESDQEEGNDGGAGVDHQLPRFVERKQWPGDGPYHDGQHADGEEPGTRHLGADDRSDSIEQPRLLHFTAPCHTFPSVRGAAE